MVCLPKIKMQTIDMEMKIRFQSLVEIGAFVGVATVHV